MYIATPGTLLWPSLRPPWEIQMDGAYRIREGAVPLHNPLIPSFAMIPWAVRKIKAVFLTDDGEGRAEAEL